MANEEKRVKPIELTDRETNTHYILDFNRDTIVFAEDRGFNWDEIGNKAATMLPLIWWIAFRRYHPAISRATSDKILENMGGMTESVLVRLRLLYEQGLEGLINTDDAPKNERWTVEM